MIDENIIEETRKCRIKTLCGTRWVKRHDTVQYILIFYEYEASSVTEAATKTRMMQKAIFNLDLIVTLCGLKDLLKVITMSYSVLF